MEGHEGHRDRLRKRFLRDGLDSFDDHNVLELLLFFSRPRVDTNLLAHRLMNTFGSLDAVFEADPEALMQVDGIGENSAALIRLVPEAARRYQLAKEKVGAVLATPEDAGRFLIPRFLTCREECAYLVCMDAAMKVKDCRILGSGGSTSVSINKKQILRIAVAQNADAVILAHNHTTGFAVPSEEDINATVQVRDALAAAGITLADHIIVADNDFVSLAEEGIL